MKIKFRPLYAVLSAVLSFGIVNAYSAPLSGTVSPTLQRANNVSRIAYSQDALIDLLKDYCGSSYVYIDSFLKWDLGLDSIDYANVWSLIYFTFEVAPDINDFLLCETVYDIHCLMLDYI